MSHFRDRVIRYDGLSNIPQLPSGVVSYTVGLYSISYSLNLVKPSISLNTATGIINTYSITKNLIVPTNGISLGLAVSQVVSVIGGITFSGQVPKINSNAICSPDVGSLILTGQTPTVV